MTIRGGAGPRDDRETGDRRPPMARRSAGTVTGYEMARSRRQGGIGGLVGFVVFVGIAAVVVLLALGTVLRPLTRSVVVGFADGNPGALGLPFVAELVREELGETMTAPASSDTTEVEFTVTAGETAAAIADRLVDEGLVRDPRAFLLIAIDRGVTGQLDAGTFLLRRNLTPDQLVGTLLEAKDPSFVIRFRTGLRLEQMTAYIQARPDEIATLEMDAADFLALVRKPPARLLADYPWLELPKGATLEGYLAAGEYRVLPDTTPDELVRKMLDRFYAAVGPARIDAAQAGDGSFHEVLTLASLVERETRREDEKALVAGVYQNRIDRDNTLNADPTVIWGVDTLALAGARPREVAPVLLLERPPGAHGLHRVPEGHRRLPDVPGPRALPGPALHPDHFLDRCGPGAGHEEEVPVLRGDPRWRRRPRLLADVRRAPPEAPQVRLHAMSRRR